MDVNWWIFINGFTLLLWLVLLECRSSKAEGSRMEEYCFKEPFTAKCQEGHVIVMTTAQYGRMRLGRCVQVDFGYIGCASDVLDRMDALCSGRQSCEIANINTALDFNNPCLELTRYLEASYECQEVVNPSKRQCQISMAIKAPRPSGYLSSLITQSTGCGSQNHPWLVEVEATQRINISVLDFGTLNEASVSESVCREYAVVREPNNNRQVTICGGKDRRRHVYTSLENTVEITLNTPSFTGNTHFLIKYDVIGCPEPKRGKNTWIRRSYNRVTVGCTTSDVEWILECHGNKWKGTAGNCSGASSQAQKNNVMQDIITSLPNGVAILIIVGLSLVISVTILVLGVVCIKRSRTASPSGTQAIPLRDNLLADEAKQVEYYYQPREKVDNASTILVEQARGSSGLRNDYEFSCGTHHPHNVLNAPPPYVDQAQNEASGKSLGGHLLEHIYESPVFSRRQKTMDTSQYFEFEFDPENPSQRTTKE